MIICKVASLCASEFSSPNIRAAIAYLHTHDLLALPLGKSVIDGEKLYLNRQSYVGKPLEQCGIESHRRYLDLQIILKGKEKIGLAQVGDPSLAASPYDPIKDKISYTGQLKGDVILREGECILLFPEDIHQPGGQVDDEPIEKLVVKIEIDR